MMKTRITLKRCLAALVGIFLIGLGVAFNAQAQLGNDPVGIFYDGVRNTLGLTGEQLGSASNVVNIAITVFLLFAARKLISVGTLIYIILYGLFVNIGTWAYQTIFWNDALPLRIVSVVIGCLSICFGVAIFIVTDIGVDPLTGLSLFIAEKLNWQYAKAKVLFDVSCTIIGFVLGGKLGIITLITSFAGGPIIQMFVNMLKKRF